MLDRRRLGSPSRVRTRTTRCASAASSRPTCCCCTTPCAGGADRVPGPARPPTASSSPSRSSLVGDGLDVDGVVSAMNRGAADVLRTPARSGRHRRPRHRRRPHQGAGQGAHAAEPPHRGLAAASTSSPACATAARSCTTWRRWSPPRAATAAPLSVADDRHRPLQGDQRRARPRRRRRGAARGRAPPRGAPARRRRRRPPRRRRDPRPAARRRTPRAPRRWPTRSATPIAATPVHARRPIAVTRQPRQRRVEGRARRRAARARRPGALRGQGTPAATAPSR